MTLRPSLLAVVVASAWLLAGCGDEAGSVENLVSALAEPAGGQQGLPLEQAECVAARVYDQLSEDEAKALAEVDDPATLTEQQREVLTEALQGCEGEAGSTEG